MVMRFQTQMSGYIMVALTERTWKRDQIFFFFLVVLGEGMYSDF